MKKIFLQLFAVLGIICPFMFIGCDKDEGVLTVDKKEITLSAETQEATFNIATDTDWSITSPDIEVGLGMVNYKSWYELDKIGGEGNGTVTVSVKKDAIPTEDKTTTLTIHGKNDKKTVSVKFKK
ncbi:BACON domain-containing protein [Proteiniphilum sp. UBA1028]|jgi:hypothetical protein|uniref:BACON domain-containing protein n=1 Tax=Proteiniphilum sp. UBA1028 TaxID=1947251 RepID=UPI000E979AA3|nr:BACON domain-containing protein [Proteiniphilum sp. UBA1028]HBG79431.1 hypothetical protein [Porphyromonadaceae bacterium]